MLTLFYLCILRNPTVPVIISLRRTQRPESATFSMTAPPVAAMAPWPTCPRRRSLMSRTSCRAPAAWCSEKADWTPEETCFISQGSSGQRQQSFSLSAHTIHVVLVSIYSSINSVTLILWCNIIALVAGFKPLYKNLFFFCQVWTVNLFITETCCSNVCLQDWITHIYIN